MRTSHADIVIPPCLLWTFSDMTKVQFSIPAGLHRTLNMEQKKKVLKWH